MMKLYQKTVKIEDGVSVEISEDRIVKVKGPHASLERDFGHARRINIIKDKNEIIIKANNSKKKVKALVGTVASHIKNMIKGAKDDFKVYLKIVYAHFPINVKIQNNKVLIENFLGERAPRIAKIIGKNTKIEVVKDDVIVSGPDIEAVTQTAANITLATRIKNKDPRIFQDGIYKYKKYYGDKIIWELKL
ncbi:MAG: 50S ribosomal protein L6 [Candidatus Helarchaeota archaeon]